MSLFSIFAVVLYSSLCGALVPDFPLATPIQDPLLNPVGWTPKPTAAPKIPRELFVKRDYLLNSASYVLVGPDQTCGYVSGLPGANFECGSSTNCVFFPVTGSSAYGAVGCCTDVLSCGFRTACVDSSTFYNSGCNGGCQLDANTMKCTDSSAPYCGSIRYAVPGATVQQFFCNAEATSTWQTAYTTFSGQSANRVFKSIARAVLESSAASSASTSTSKSKSSSSSSISSSSSGSPTSSSSSTSGTAAPTTSPTQTASSDKKSSNTGAIVGGLVGGFAVLGLIGAGAFFLYKRKYGRKDDTTTPHTPLGHLDPGKTGGPMPHEGYYAPQSPPQPYMSSQTQYQPVPVEMPSDFVQRPPGQMVYEKSATTPTTGNMSPPLNQHYMSATTPTTGNMSPPLNQHYMSPATQYNRPISEIDSTSPNLR